MLPWDVFLSPGAKYFEWERKGVPLRLEIGPRDVKSNSVMMAKRLTGEKVCADAIHFNYMTLLLTVCVWVEGMVVV
jgi:prolyl-tRNA synthetase